MDVLPQGPNSDAAEQTESLGLTGRLVVAAFAAGLVLLGLGTGGWAMIWWPLALLVSSLCFGARIGAVLAGLGLAGLVVAIPVGFVLMLVAADDGTDCRSQVAEANERRNFPLNYDLCSQPDWQEQLDGIHRYSGH